MVEIFAIHLNDWKVEGSNSTDARRKNIIRGREGLKHGTIKVGTMLSRNNVVISAEAYKGLATFKQILRET